MPSVKIGARSYDIPDDSDLQEIVSILSGEGKMPTTGVANLPVGVFGEYSPFKHHIDIDQMYGGTIPTVTHEFSHALDKIMGNVRYNLGQETRQLTPGEQRFSEGYTKLYPDSTKLPSNYEPNTYRTLAGERRAYGVGNMSTKRPTQVEQNPERPHMDATMATEAAILRDLFKRRK